MMPRHILIAFGIITLCVTFYACGKSNSSPSSPGNPVTPPPPTTPIVSTMNINMAYTDGGSQYELIISEPTGKILLDTLATPPTAIIAALRTNDTLVDVTAIVNNANGVTYTAYIYQSVNASTIPRLTQTGYNSLGGPLKAGTTTSSQILYENVPPGILNSSANQTLFTNFYNNPPGQIVVSPTDNTVVIHYNNYPGNYAYLLIPSAGLYNLHAQSNAIDTVDCTHMDTAISLTFDRPEPFTINTQYSSFIGIFDTTDLTKVIGLSDYLLAPPSRLGVDFEYPNIPVQKYELSFSATNASNDVLEFYTCASTIPTTLPLPKEADFNISSTQNDNFVVTFPGNKPTYYFVQLTSPNLTATLYSRPDSSTMHPVSFLTNLKSKLLKNVNLSLLDPTEVEVDNYNGMNYSTYLPFAADPNVPKHISLKAKLIKHLP
jgi:hypothetical protein